MVSLSVSWRAQCHLRWVQRYYDELDSWCEKTASWWGQDEMLLAPMTPTRATWTDLRMDHQGNVVFPWSFLMIWKWSLHPLLDACAPPVVLVYPAPLTWWTLRGGLSLPCYSSSHEEGGIAPVERKPLWWRERWLLGRISWCTCVGLMSSQEWWNSKIEKENDQWYSRNYVLLQVRRLPSTLISRKERQPHTSHFMWMYCHRKDRWGDKVSQPAVKFSLMIQL